MLSHMIYPEQISTSSVYLQDFRSEPCQVCGENASGWHCGSITCEACKKFFLRSVNGEYLKYKCIRDKKCLITRTTRTQCQHCRYKKCISVGMKLTENSNPKIEEIFKEIPCVVCQAASSGLHFGATTCEGCKGFFRRMIKERSPYDYKCLEKNNCEINTLTRNICRACRFRKCRLAGMSIEGSRIGRQSNLFKHKMIEMQRRGLIQPQLVNIITSNLSNSRRRTTTNNQDSSIRFEEKLEPQVFQQIIEIENAYISHLNNLPVCTMETDNVWNACISQLNAYNNRVNDFINHISSFDALNFGDRTSFVGLSTHSVIVMCFCIQTLQLDRENKNWNYLNISSNSIYFQQRYPFLFELHHLTSSLENQLQLLQLDHKEIGLMLCLLIVSIENNKSEQTEHIEEEFFSSLYDYMSAKRGTNSKDYFLLTVQIPFLHRINKLISTYINDLKY